MNTSQRDLFHLDRAASRLTDAQNEILAADRIVGPSPHLEESLNHLRQAYVALLREILAW
jgi:hypothetical protein